MRVTPSLALSSVLLACGGGGVAASFGESNPGVTGAPEQTETSAAQSSSSSAPSQDTSTSTSGSSASTGSSTGRMVWDMGMPDFGPQQPAGCEGKIDFLFVISAAGNMKDDQERLLASFPGFIDTIEDQFPDFDVHILVANPDGPWLMNDCSLCMTDCDPQAFPPLCGATLTPCDKKIGAGVTYPAGANASNRRCELAGGRRYIVSGEQDMKDAFACVAQVGSGGGAATGQAMVAALQPAINDPDNEFACNGGFLRDDALLVVTIIQDTYDEDSLGTVDEWIAGLRAAKHGDDNAFMVLVLTTDVDVGYQQLCLPNEFNQTKNRLRLLAEGVEHGFIDSICMDNYAPFFAEHASHLVDLCDDFVPPG